MNPGAPAGWRRTLACFVALVLLGTVPTGRAMAAGGVTRADLDAAEAEVSFAEWALGEVSRQLFAAEASHTRMTQTLQRLEVRRLDEESQATERKSALRTRIGQRFALRKQWCSPFPALAWPVNSQHFSCWRPRA